MSNRISPMTDEEFAEFIDTKAPQNLNIIKYLITTRNKLKEFNKIAVSYSGGSDSDIVLDLIELVKPPEGGEIKYVFFDTGLEWDATLRHVKETEEKYGVNIERLRSKKTIPVAVKERGIPFISKEISEMLYRLQKHGFDWKEENIDKLDNCQCAIDWWYGNRSKQFSILNLYGLKDFLLSYPPKFKFAAYCCNAAKKQPAYKFEKEYKADLRIDGQRRAEGGTRSTRYKSCFSPMTAKGYAHYMPLFFWTDQDKEEYKNWREIQYSDCYEIWGFKRTGCLGCPCNSRAEDDLETAKAYEPNKVKAAYAVFGQSYEYRRKYNEFKKNMKQGKLQERENDGNGLHSKN